MRFTKVLDERLEAHGYRSNIISTAHLNELQKEIEARYKKGLLDEELYNVYLASFDFECHQKLAEARSLIIVSAPQPQIQITFIWKDTSYPVIIPPTYNFSADDQVADFLKAYLEPQGYQLQKVRLPEKLLAVRSGLAQYGKNNITHVKGMGSFHRPVVFISDFPCETDSWGEPKVMEQCEKCSACQKVCPAIKDVAKWIEAGATFDREETAFILNSVSDDRLPRKTLKKLKKLDIMEYYDVMGRNLRALIEQRL